MWDVNSQIQLDMNNIFVWSKRFFSTIFLDDLLIKIPLFASIHYVLSKQTGRTLCATLLKVPATAAHILLF